MLSSAPRLGIFSNTMPLKSVSSVSSQHSAESITDSDIGSVAVGDFCSEILTTDACRITLTSGPEVTEKLVTIGLGNGFLVIPHIPQNVRVQIGQVDAEGEQLS